MPKAPAPLFSPPQDCILATKPSNDNTRNVTRNTRFSPPPQDCPPPGLKKPLRAILFSNYKSHLSQPCTRGISTGRGLYNGAPQKMFYNTAPQKILYNTAPQNKLLTLLFSNPGLSGQNPAFRMRNSDSRRKNQYRKWG